MHCPKCETKVDKLPSNISKWTNYECVKCEAQLNRKRLMPHMIWIVIICLLTAFIKGFSELIVIQI